MKRTPLRRRAQLRARTPLRRTTPLAAKAPLQLTPSMAASQRRAAVAGLRLRRLRRDASGSTRRT